MKIRITRMLALLTVVSLTSINIVHAAPFDIKITPNTLNAMVAPTATELVTIGIPFNSCILTDLSKFRLLDEAKREVPIFIKPTLWWTVSRSPCFTSSVRAIKVQFVFNATAGVKTYTWDLAGRKTSVDLSEAPVSEIVTDNPIKNSRKEPRVFGIADPAYLATSGIVPPTAAVSDNVYDKGYLPLLWEDAALELNYNLSGVNDWIYDRVTTNYRQALRRGELAYYREAYLSHEWYISKLEVTGTNTELVDYCLGGFDFAGKADTYSDTSGSLGKGGGCDTKYIYPQAYKIHLALTGDDSWQPSENGIPSASGLMDTRQQAWTTIARLLVSGDFRTGDAKTPAIPAAGFIKPYASVSTPFTERDLGFGLQAVLNACELSLDAAVCGWADTIVDNIRQMQIANPDGIQHYGYLSHSLRLHESTVYLPWIGSLVTSYSGATSIIVENTFGDGYADLTAGKIIRVGSGSQNFKLASNALDNGNGTWTLNLVTPVTAAAGTEVKVVFLANGTTVDLNHPTDRIFSPWMQAITADAIWQYYNWADSSIRKQKAADILLGFARAYAAYALDGTQLSSGAKSLIEQAFDDFGPVQVFSAVHKAGPCSSITRAPYTAYFANALMATPDNNQPYMTFITQQGGQNHNHIPEAFFQLSLGLLFETDPAKKAAMQAVLDDLLEWFEDYSCTSNLGDNRAYSWSNKLDPWGTYSYVQNLPIPDPSDALAYKIASQGSYSELVVAHNSGLSTAAFQLGASRNAGATVETVFLGNDEVEIAGTVKPQATDIGSAGAIFIVIRTTTPAGDEWTYRDPDGVFKPWDNFIASLEPAYETAALKFTDGFEIYSGKLVPATHRIYIGYSRDDVGILHYTGYAMLLEVTD